MPDFVFGYDGVLYYSAALLDQRPGGSGSVDYTNATWVEIDNVTDVDGDFESESVDTTTRAEAKTGWNSEVKTTRNGQLSFTMRWKPGDTAFDEIRDAWLSGSGIALLDLDGPVATNGSQGLVGNFSISFSQKKPVKGIQVVEVQATIQGFPDWVEVDTGVLTAVTP